MKDLDFICYGLGISDADKGKIKIIIKTIKNKGFLTARDLRGWLGEFLPGAFSKSADILSVSCEELNDMLYDRTAFIDDSFFDELNDTYVKELRELKYRWELRRSIYDLKYSVEKALKDDFNRLRLLIRGVFR